MAFDKFTGEATSRMDSKARVSIPAAFRKILEIRSTTKEPGSRTPVVLIYGDPRRKFVAGYSADSAQDLLDSIARLPVGSPYREAAQRQLVAKMISVDIDDDGRIVLPGPVRTKLGLAGEVADPEVYFSGALDYFELWKQSTHAEDAAEREVKDVAVLGPDEDILAIFAKAGLGV